MDEGGFYLLADHMTCFPVSGPRGMYAASSGRPERDELLDC